MNNKLKGSLALLLGTLIWGCCFVAQSVGMDHVGPFTFQAARCALAVIGLLPVIAILDKHKGRSFIKAWANKNLWKAGLLCGIPLFLATGLQQVGLVYTSAGKAAFLTAMYIVMVPVLGLFLRRKFSAMIPVSVALAVAGLYFLSCVGVTEINPGDLLMLGCAVAFAVQILVVDRFASQVDALRLNCLQALVCSVCSGIVMIFTEEITISGLLDCWLPIGYAGFLSMGAAYALQIVGQKRIEPTSASLIMSLESVFAVLSSWLLIGESLTAYEVIGCVLMFVAVILSQIPVGKK